MSSKVANKYTWNLEKILKDNTIEELIDSYLIKQQEYVDLFNSKPFESIQKLQKFHEKEEELDLLSNRIGNYISNKINIDLSDNKWFLMSQELQNKTITFSQQLATLQDEILNNQEHITELLKDPSLTKYQRYYHQIFRTKKHKLKPEIKKFAATYSPLESSYYSLFSLLFDKELVIKDAVDSKGKSHKIINYSSYQKLIKEKDRELRKSAYINWTNAIHSQRETLSRLMYYNFLELNVNAKNLNFEKGYYESSVFSDEIKDETIPFIYEQVSKWSKQVNKYYRINKKILKHNYKLKSIKPWDMSLPIFNKKENYSIEEAKKITIESLKILGTEYTKNLQESFSNESIDWLPKKNKISGAYCIGETYGLENKYVFLNYNNKFDDISTLVHELGHALHAIEFCKAQDIYANCSIFTAEIPSILNEILLNFHFLEKYEKKKNYEKLLEIYDRLISNFISTTSSQIVFSEWEYDINQVIMQGQGITADLSENLYLQKQIKYLGLKKKKLSVLSKKGLTKILTVPHFYCGNFYVYKYSIGMVVAVVFAYQIMNGKNREQMLKNYFKFLSSGSSLNNLETIKILGLSLEDEQLWSNAKKILNSWISKYSQLYSKLYKK